MHDPDSALGKLKTAIAAEYDARSEPTQQEMIEWLLGDRSDLVRNALRQLVHETFISRLDDAATEDFLEANPDLREREPPMRLLADSLDFKLWFLFGLPGRTLIECAKANELLVQLRFAELEASREMMAEHINELADETIRGPEEDFGKDEHHEP
jgi:hypothetical protein